VRFDDFILRAIAQLAQAVARILKRVQAGEHVEARAELSEAYDALLGADRVFLGMVDAATLANLLGSPDKTCLLAKLSLLEARLAEAHGDAMQAEQLRARARTLSALAREADGGLPCDLGPLDAP
jgi:hypothetical protein